MNLFVYRVLSLVVLLALLAILIAERSVLPSGASASPKVAAPMQRIAKPALAISARAGVPSAAGPGESLRLPVTLSARADLGEVLVELRPGPGLSVNDPAPIRSWVADRSEPREFVFQVGRGSVPASWVDVFVRSLPPSPPGLATFRFPLVFAAGPASVKPSGGAQATVDGLRVLPAAAVTVRKGDGD